MEGDSTLRTLVGKELFIKKHKDRFIREEKFNDFTLIRRCEVFKFTLLLEVIYC